MKMKIEQVAEHTSISVCRVKAKMILMRQEVKTRSNR
jgi:hypothetical protein